MFSCQYFNNVLETSRDPIELFCDPRRVGTPSLKSPVLEERRSGLASSWISLESQFLLSETISAPKLFSVTISVSFSLPVRNRRTGVRPGPPVLILYH